MNLVSTSRLFSSLSGLPTEAVRRMLMQVDLTNTPLPVASLPPRYSWSPWSDSRLASHAVVLYEGFANTCDASFMKALSTLEGCQKLLLSTIQSPHFLPEATWMSTVSSGGTTIPVSSIQVLGSYTRVARIQNVAVLPEHRGIGIGRATLMRCLRSCRSLGYDTVELEVTSQNTTAIELYRSLGFTQRRAFLQPVET